MTCCVALLMSYMLANIMFYNVESRIGDDKLDLGATSITWTECLIG